MAQLARDSSPKSEGSGNGERAAWLAQTLEKVEQVARMPSGWDSHDGLPLDPAIKAAVERTLVAVNRQDLPVPAVVLGSAGTVQLEWRHDGRELEVEFDSPTSISFLQLFPDGHTRDGHVTGDLNETLRRLTDWVCRR